MKILGRRRRLGGSRRRLLKMFWPPKAVCQHGVPCFEKSLDAEGGLGGATSRLLKKINVDYRRRVGFLEKDAAGYLKSGI